MPYEEWLNRCSNNQSEEDELFSDVTDNFVRSDFQYVEVNSLGKRSAFSNNCNITNFDLMGRRAVSGNVSVSLFISVVFGDVVKIISSDDDGSGHFSWDNDALEDFSSDTDIAGEGTFFIDVVSFDGLLRGFEAKSDIFVIPDTWWSFLSKEFFAVKENIILFLKSIESLS